MGTHQSLPYLRETLLFLALTGVLIPLLSVTDGVVGQLVQRERKGR